MSCDLNGSANGVNLLASEHTCEYFGSCVRPNTAWAAFIKANFSDLDMEPADSRVTTFHQDILGLDVPMNGVGVGV